MDQVRSTLGSLVALLAIVTCTFGNLAAYGQTNIKRLLAYSTIAHAGYMMMAVPPVLALLGSDVHGAQNAVGSLVIYISVYLFMNLGAFAVVAFLRNAMHSEEIADYAGLLRRCPGVAICFSIILLSLDWAAAVVGIPGEVRCFRRSDRRVSSDGQSLPDGSVVRGRFELRDQSVLLPADRPADDDDARTGIAPAVFVTLGVISGPVCVARYAPHSAVDSRMGAAELAGLGRCPVVVHLVPQLDLRITPVLGDLCCRKEIA